MKSKKTRSSRLFGKKKITPALLVGLLMGVAITVLGFYSAITYEELGGYFAAGVGVCFTVLVYLAAR
jgi:hypothetical protein